MSLFLRVGAVIAPPMVTALAIKFQKSVCSPSTTCVEEPLRCHNRIKAFPTVHIEDELNFYDLVPCSAGGMLSSAEKLLLCGNLRRNPNDYERDYADYGKIPICDESKIKTSSELGHSIEMTDVGSCEKSLAGIVLDRMVLEESVEGRRNEDELRRHEIMSDIEAVEEMNNNIIRNMDAVDEAITKLISHRNEVYEDSKSLKSYIAKVREENRQVISHARNRLNDNMEVISNVNESLEENNGILREIYEELDTKMKLKSDMIERYVKNLEIRKYKIEKLD